MTTAEILVSARALSLQKHLVLMDSQFEEFDEPDPVLAWLEETKPRLV